MELLNISNNNSLMAIGKYMTKQIKERVVRDIELQIGQRDKPLSA